MKEKSFISDHPFAPRQFDGVEEVFKGFQSKAFIELNRYEKNDKINFTLYELIGAHTKRGFLLTEVIDFVTRVIKARLIEKYSFHEFELWLEQFSGLPSEKSDEIRGHIVGKHIPRDEYQTFFPIGMGKKYKGTHFIAAHQSPDLDTIVASFWGWADAFAARVSSGLHIWNVPGGAPRPHIEVDLLFFQMLGAGVFESLAKTREELTLNSLDLLTQEGYLRKTADDLMLSINHERTQNAVVLVDPDGYYIGDWRSIDVEGVRQVIMLLNNCLRWLESQLHVRLISLFAKEDISRAEFEQFVQDTFDEKIKDLEPALEFTVRQLNYLDLYLKNVLECQDGLEASLKVFAKAVEKNGIADFSLFQRELENLTKSKVFDASGAVVENRPLLFLHLEKVVKSLASEDATPNILTAKTSSSISFNNHAAVTSGV